MLTKSSENTGKMDDESRPEKAPKIFKYVISGVSKEISEKDIENATLCKEATRISKLVDKKTVETETVILDYENSSSFRALFQLDI